VVIVTTGPVSGPAERRADDLNVKLVDGDALVDMIEELDAEDILEEYAPAFDWQEDVEPATDPTPDPANHGDVNELWGASAADDEGPVDTTPSPPFSWHDILGYVIWVVCIGIFLTAQGSGVGLLGVVLILFGYPAMFASMLLDIRQCRQESDYSPSYLLYSVLAIGLSVFGATAYWFNRARRDLDNV
jgi:hypothetical protein